MDTKKKRNTYVKTMRDIIPYDDGVAAALHPFSPTLPTQFTITWELDILLHGIVI
jgi:hypothetical protein